MSAQHLSHLADDVLFELMGLSGHYRFHELEVKGLTNRVHALDSKALCMSNGQFQTAIGTDNAA